jgi:hypothetical protein
LASSVVGGVIQISSDDIRLAGGQIPTMLANAGTAGHKMLSPGTKIGLQLLNHLQNLKYELMTEIVTNFTTLCGYASDPLWKVAVGISSNLNRRRYRKQ